MGVIDATQDQRRLWTSNESSEWEAALGRQVDHSLCSCRVWYSRFIFHTVIWCLLCSQPCKNPRCMASVPWTANSVSDFTVIYFPHHLVMDNIQNTSVISHDFKFQFSGFFIRISLIKIHDWTHIMYTNIECEFHLYCVHILYQQF